MKKHKNFICLIVIITSIFSMSPITYASSYSTGKAVIPWYWESPTTYCGFFVSNITDSSIDVTVTFYNEDGTIVTDDNNIDTGRIAGYASLINYDDQNTDSTLTFTLNAHCTSYFRTATNPNTYKGYGVIQWQQNGSALQGLVCYGVFFLPENERQVIEINSSLPF